MSTAELVYEKTRHLPENLQSEALHYVDYLLAHQHPEGEAVAWTKFSSSELTKQYVLADAIYDQD